MLAATPSTVVEIVVLADHSQSFVGIVEIGSHNRAERTMRVRAPELDLHDLVFRGFRQLVFSVRYRCAIKVVSRRYPKHFQDSRRNVGMAVGRAAIDSLRHIRPSDEEGDVHILFIGTPLAWE